MTKEERRAIAAKAAQSALQTVAVAMQSEAAINKAKGDDQPQSRSLTWCQCSSKGACLGCMIEISVRRDFGSQGVEYLKAALQSASSETAVTKSTMKPENFIQAALNISAERRKGYERREHGDIVNKRCADDLETLCQEYLSRLGERQGG